MNELDELRTLSVRQLAEATGIARWRVHELLAQGKGPPHFRVGRTYRFPVAGIRQWMQEQSTNNSQETSQCR
jgi:excisionase family DNA binding protein